MTQRERGTVISWNDQEGHGRIQADQGDVLWAHFSFIIRTGYRSLSVNDRVEFTRNEPGYAQNPDERLQAKNVVVIAGAPIR